MRDRLLTLLCALGAAGLFVSLFLGGGGSPAAGGEVSRPTTDEAGPNGYLAVRRWLEVEHLRPRALVEPPASLAKLASTQGNVLIVTLPGVSAYRQEDARALRSWIEAGNTLIALAALADAPDWARGSGARVRDEVHLLAGLALEPRRTQSSTADRSGGSRSYLEPNRAHPYFTGATAIAAISDDPPHRWQIGRSGAHALLALGHERRTGDEALWTLTAGRGRIVVCDLGSVLTNRAIGLGDNGRFLANLLAIHLGPNGGVWFDDAHQGAGGAYDPQRFFQDHRLHQTLFVLVATWLIWVLGGTRLRAVEEVAAAPEEAGLVRATGLFLERVLTPSAAARRLVELFLAARSWEHLGRQARIAQGELQQLRAWYDIAGVSGPVPLERLHNLIVTLKARLHS